MIKFGTDGWRAGIAEEFTFANVRLVAQAAVNYLKGKGCAGRPFYVGYDRRFLSENFAMEVAGVAASNGMECFYSSKALSSPALSFAVKDNDACGGIMITASHNPPEYNGIKFKASYGGSADSDITGGIESELKILASPGAYVHGQKRSGQDIVRFDPGGRYFERLSELIDLKLISSSKINVVVDPMHGSAAGYLSEILGCAGMKITEINANRDPLFGGSNPEPLPVNLEDLISLVKEKHLEDPRGITVGLALDGDGDRISAVDGSGDFLNPHNIFCILLKHLVEGKKMRGEVVKTFNGSNLVDLLARQYGLTLHETPIGFKYICKLMLERDILIGGEESGGIGIKGHIPERDAVLAALLLLEAVAMEGKSLKGILNDIMKAHGFYYYDRIDLHLPEEKKARTLEILKGKPPEVFAGEKVVQVKDLDGIKLVLGDGSWILFRASGTEPLLRIYAEAGSQERVKRMLSDGEALTRK